MTTIAVASGKGGTGKTTVAVSLALAVQNLPGRSYPVRLVDADVEAPNAHIALKPDLTERNEVAIQIPLVDADLCTACGRCAEVCQFHAIAVIGGKTLVFQELCHGCGSCTLVCPENAISETPHVLGILEQGFTPAGVHFSRGLMNVGEPMAVPIIRQLKKRIPAPAGEEELVIIDSPPGTSCPVVEAVREADVALLVTEPTPFGLHDLKLMAQVVHDLQIPAAVVVNRDGVGNADVDAFCAEAKLPILLRIPLDREIGAGIARGMSLLEIRPEYAAAFADLYATLVKMARTPAVPGGAR